MSDAPLTREQLIHDLTMIRNAVLAGHNQWSADFLGLIVGWIEQDAALADKIDLIVQHGENIACQ